MVWLGLLALAGGFMGLFALPLVAAGLLIHDVVREETPMPAQSFACPNGHEFRVIGSGDVVATANCPTCGEPGKPKVVRLRTTDESSLPPRAA